jgi:hypothetical protein
MKRLSNGLKQAESPTKEEEENKRKNIKINKFKQKTNTLFPNNYLH